MPVRLRSVVCARGRTSGATDSTMNNNSNGVTAGDIVFLVVCILGLLTGLAGIVMLTPAVALLGFVIILSGLAYFGAMQAVDA